MARVMLHADGRVEVIEPPTEEEREQGRAALLRLAAALGRLMARQDFEEELRVRAAGVPPRDQGSSDVLSDCAEMSPLASAHSTEVKEVAPPESSSMDQSSSVTPRG